MIVDFRGLTPSIRSMPASIRFYCDVCFAFQFLTRCKPVSAEQGLDT
jgi:hypothetical protein